jgi:Lrp/AsnC family leucine-responsive transcriptional regulator
MRGLDETDREILRLLLADGRRPFSEIAETVGLSAPAVSDRVDRLRELGVIEQFTVELDRSRLRDGQSLLVRIDCEPGTGRQVRDELGGVDAIEHVFLTADDLVVCTALTAQAEIGSLLRGSLSLDAVRDYEVKLLAESAWQPGVGEAELDVECVECGNTVTREGEQERIDGTLYHFCCNSCRESFLAQYEQLSEGA